MLYIIYSGFQCIHASIRPTIYLLYIRNSCDGHRFQNRLSTKWVSKCIRCYFFCLAFPYAGPGLHERLDPAPVGLSTRCRPSAPRCAGRAGCAGSARAGGGSCAGASGSCASGSCSAGGSGTTLPWGMVETSKAWKKCKKM